MWTVFFDMYRNAHFAVDGKNLMRKNSSSEWEKCHGVQVRNSEAYHDRYPADRQFTPAEARKLFKQVGTPDGNPIPSDKPAKKRGFTDSQLLIWIIGLINRGELFKHVHKGSNRRDLRLAMRLAKKAGGK